MCEIYFFKACSGDEVTSLNALDDKLDEVDSDLDEYIEEIQEMLEGSFLNINIILQ